MEVIRDAADGLQAIHQAGLIHRDLKPANLFLTPEGRTKVADLGLARAEESAERMTVTGAVVGTPAYMSPEQASGAADLDIRTDIYALGATLYCLITGQAPYQGQTPYAVVAKVLNDDFPDPRVLIPDLPIALAELILCCTARVRLARPATPQELANHCRDLLTNQAALHRLKSDADSTAKTLLSPAAVPKKRRFAWAFLAVALLVLGCSLWWNWVHVPNQSLTGWTVVAGNWERTPAGNLLGKGTGVIRRNEGFAANTSLRAAFVQTGPGSMAISIPEWGITYGLTADNRDFELSATGPASILFSAPWPISLGETCDVRLNRWGSQVTVVLNGRLSGLVQLTEALAATSSTIEFTQNGELNLIPPMNWSSDAANVEPDAQLALALAKRTVAGTWFREAGAGNMRILTLPAALKSDLNFKLAPGQSITVEPYPLDTWTCAQDAPGHAWSRHCTADGLTPSLPGALDPRFPTGCLLIKVGDEFFKAGRVTAAKSGAVSLLINDATPEDAGGSIRVRMRGPE